MSALTGEPARATHARVPRATRAAGIVLALLVVAGIAQAAVSEAAGGTIGDLRHLAVAVLVPVLILARCVLVPSGRRVWLAFGVGALLNLVAGAVWIVVYRESPQSPADLLFAAGYLAYGVGLALYLSRRVAYALRTLTFDAVGIATYVTAIGTAVLLRPIVRHAGMESPAAVLNIFYPAVDAAIWSVVFAVSSYTGRRRGRQDLLLGGAFVVLCASDLGYVLDLAGQADMLQRWQAPGWEVAMLLLTAAAWAPPAPAGTLRIGGWWESLPTLSWTVAGGGVLVAAWAWRLPAAVVILAAATLALAAARALLLVVEVRALVVTRSESLVDELTGLPNQRAIFDELDVVTREDGTDGRRIALIVCDLVGFRELTDTLGHEAARRLLAPVAERLGEVVPGMLGRLSGDEFAAIVEDGDPLAVATAMSAALCTPVILDGLAVSVRPVIGYARFPDDAATPAELGRRAGVARRDAKDRGLDVAAYDSERDGHSRERLGLAADLRSALGGAQRHGGGGLWIAYQPQLDLRSGAIRGAEALIRWRHPTRGELAPMEFLPIAQLDGQMAALTDWMLEHAIAEAAALNAAGLPLSISVNVSAATLVDVALPDRIAAALRRHGVPPRQLVVEITEHAVMSDRQRCLQVLEGIAALGVEVSIDDFGTGQSSLAQLRHLPARELKIDRSFVNGMQSDPLDAEIVHLVIALGGRMGVRVVAEGIETAEQRAAVTELGCDVGQGFGLGRPMAASSFRAWLTQNARSGRLATASH